LYPSDYTITCHDGYYVGFYKIHTHAAGIVKFNVFFLVTRISLDIFKVVLRFI
jgi:hypothetical protein